MAQAVLKRNLGTARLFNAVLHCNVFGFRPLVFEGSFVAVSVTHSRPKGDPDMRKLTAGRTMARNEATGCSRCVCVA